ncbi:DUF3017 domain-containing protein [Streptomyces sp. NPDC060205]|uniref:DUF3017 domain-containing protein n=1 Tax=Streptomyces sp. NPDC060205 TaxID=3347072 RepID=UPI0036539A4F
MDPADNGGPARQDAVRPGSGPAAAPASASASASASGPAPDPAAGPVSDPVSGPDAGSGSAPESASGAGTEAGSAAEAAPEAGTGAAQDDELTVSDAVSAPGPDGRPRRVTRRFPLFTRDTARPEGGGRAAPRGAPAPARQWPILAVTALVGLGLLLTALDAFKAGTLLIGIALLAGAAMRWVLPDVGMLAVRSRFTDLVTYGVLGATIALLAMMAQPNPWLELPFLDDTLHFTIRT